MTTPTSTDADLTTIVGGKPPFLSALMPTPSEAVDAEDQFATRWKNLTSELGDGWTEEALAKIEQRLDALRNSASTLAVVASADGHAIVEELIDPVEALEVREDPLPRLVPLIDSRRRTISHIVVAADRTGADLTAFDGGTVLDEASVDGEELHIHRGHPGGWSQRRFQQRAENTWDANAEDVAEAISEMATKVGARLVAVAGAERASSLIVKALDDHPLDARVERLESGDTDGIADEVVKHVADVHATDLVELSDRFQQQLSSDTAVATTEATLRALNEGRVETLLVNDDWTDDETPEVEVRDLPAGARAIDLAVAAAITTDAEVVPVPRYAALEGPIAAILRW